MRKGTKMKGAYPQLFYIAITILLWKTTWAQNTVNTNQISYDLRLSSAQFWAHRADMHIPNTAFLNVDVGVTYHPSGEKAWAYNNNLPRVGIRYGYFHFPDEELMGRGHALYANLSKDLVRIENHRIYYELGMGLGLLTRIYDPVDNPKQNAISSPLNVYVDARFGYRLQWKGEWTIGGQLFHFSNAANRKPNSGMNFFGYFVGYSTLFPQVSVADKSQQKAAFSQKKNQVLVGGLISMRQHDFQAPHDVIGNIFVEKNWQLAPNYRLGIGGQVFYEAYEKVYSRWQKRWGDPVFFQDVAWHQTLSGGIYINNEWVFDRFSIFFHKGVYIFGQNQRYETFADYGQGPVNHGINFNQSIFFHRLGYRYKVSQNLSLQLSMFTHFAKARYTEIGFTYELF